MSLDPSDIARLRIEYSSRLLRRRDLDVDPISQFKAWFSDALAAQVREPNAMTLATATRDGAPSARIVLLKGIDEGFVFFTNYQSQKGQELDGNPRAALVFFWAELFRQVRVEGSVSRVSAEESDAYFASRPPEARLGAAASPQSRAIESRDELERAFDGLRRLHPEGNIPRPPHWGGYRVIPQRIEFWQGRESRLHDRFLYTRDTGAWQISRLAP